MKQTLRFALAAGLALGSIAGVAETASALPMSGLDPAIATSADTAKNVEDVRWICPPYRPCFWAPGGYWGGGYGWRGGGWRGGGWRGGWHGGGWRGGRGGWHGGGFHGGGRRR